MAYHGNGFNWHDLYYMPIKLREFYWRELLKTKKEEQESVEKISNSKSNPSKVRRR